MCRNVCTHLCAGTCAPTVRQTRIQSPRQQQKGQRACLFIPNTKNNTLPPSRQGELFNYKYQGRSRLRPTPSPRALCQAKPKISLLCGGVGKPQPNDETRERRHGTPGAHGAGPARAGRQRGVLFTSSAPSERGLGARARPHTHTHIHRRVCVESPRAIPQPARIQRESKTGVSPG